MSQLRRAVRRLARDLPPEQGEALRAVLGTGKKAGGKTLMDALDKCYQFFHIEIGKAIVQKVGGSVDKSELGIAQDAGGFLHIDNIPVVRNDDGMQGRLFLAELSFGEEGGLTTYGWTDDDSGIHWEEDGQKKSLSLDGDWEIRDILHKNASYIAQAFLSRLSQTIAKEGWRFAK